jgi:hypothetical protein
VNLRPEPLGVRSNCADTERGTLRLKERRMGQRPVTVIVSEQEIDFLLARHYELTRADDHSIGRAVSA